MSKGGFMKDALILFAITLVAGACLGGVYGVTKEPIAIAEQKAKETAFRPFCRTRHPLILMRMMRVVSGRQQTGILPEWVLAM